jgi:hypothetical protein
MGVAVSRGLAFGLFVQFATCASAALTYSGDADLDGELAIPDVVLLVNQLPSAETYAGLDLVLADANQDGPFDAADVDYVVDVILGRANPKPIGGPVRSGAVSFWAVEDLSAAAIEENVVLRAVSSFWVFEPPPTQASSDNAVLRASPSFWVEEPAPTQAISENAILRANPSFEVQE